MVVVGAGLAGLVAARALADAGASVVVLEARDRVGGRMLSQTIGEGTVIDVGGQWIGPGQDRMYELASKAGVETFPTHTAGDKVLELGGRLRQYSGTIPRLAPHVLVDIALAQRKLNRMAAIVDPSSPWEARRAADWDGQTMHTWMRRNVRTAAARSLFGIACSIAWGSAPEDLSLLHVLFYVASAGSFERILDTEGGAQQDRFRGGSQMIAEWLATGLDGRVHLSAPVRRIEQNSAGVRVGADGIEVEASRTIVAVPPNLAGRIDYDPPLPAGRDQLTQQMPQGATIKCQALYESPFWRADGLSGEAISAEGPVGVVFDNSPAEGTPGVLVGFVVGRAARKLDRAHPDQRRDAVVECFARLFGGRAARPLDYVERDWSKEVWTRGCPVCHFPPGGWTAWGPWLRAPAGRIHWSGTETATQWSGYMDGAAQSGERVAVEVLAGLDGSS